MTGSKEKKVRDIMVPLQDYSTVFSENALKDAIFILRSTFNSGCANGSQAHRSILVFDNSKRLVGTLSFRDILGILQLNGEMPKHWDGVFTRLCLNQANKKVKDVMNPIGQLSVNSEDSILDAVYLIVNNELELIPVLDKGNVIGMVRTVEIFYEVSQLVEEHVF
ncbi:CBS domain-containing protein [Desulforamulus aquiferis]|uniref:CBS domain-containing protein n=1 Tax=Desulforamulus aquiferis TaxID=1397668 RepID=A0AAW7ZCF1_9FIRM|nr:CBS domain-containing protein [Desulforamulus aquiferis]MDO7787081.1 CBS domain-containing protein [Desulforamulus aquiferis]